MKNHFKFLIFFALGAFLLSSCSVTRMRYSRGLNIELSVFSKDKGKNNNIKPAASKNESPKHQANGDEILSTIPESKITVNEHTEEVKIEGDANGIHVETIKENREILIGVETMGIEPVFQSGLNDHTIGKGSKKFEKKVNRFNSTKPVIKKSKTEEAPLTGAFGIIGFVLSLLGLICILLSVLIAFVLLLLGIIFSAIGMGKGRPNRELGIAGLTIGIVGIVLVLFFIMYLIWFFIFI